MKTTNLTILCVLATFMLSSCGSGQSDHRTASPKSNPVVETTMPLKPTGWITYDSKQDGYWGIYIIKADGTGQPTPLTAHLNGEYYSSWKPDGTQIAFSSFRDSVDATEPTSSIYTIDLDGTRPTRLTDSNAWDAMPSWSPDGMEIAFVTDRDSGDASNIYIMGSDGTRLRRLTDDPTTDDWPSWSPNGDRIAFRSDRSGTPQIYVTNADGTGLVQLTRERGPVNYPYIGITQVNEVDEVIVDEVVDGGPADLAGLKPGDLIRAADGNPLEQPDPLMRLLQNRQPGDKVSFTVARDGVEHAIVVKLGSRPQMNAYPAWSPDGREIAFSSNRDGDWDIYVMETDGGDQRALTNNRAMDLYPSWSPDGQYITFSSDSHGNMDVYVMRADGDRMTRLTGDPTDEYPPKWSPAQAVVSDEPRFGIPFCIRDIDNDGHADVSTKIFYQDDETFFVSFPYANVSKDLSWSVKLVMEETEPLGYSEPWGENDSGLLTLSFPNYTSYSIDNVGAHGVGMGHFPLGTIDVQLIIEDEIVQQVECQVIED